MHEMSLMSNLLERAKEALCPYDVRKVNSITVQTGPLANIMPAAFEFAFETLSAGTIFDGAELITEQLPICVKCSCCGNISKVQRMPEKCPVCAGEGLSITEGAEVYISAIDFEEN